MILGTSRQLSVKYEPFKKNKFEPYRPIPWVIRV